MRYFYRYGFLPFISLHFYTQSPILHHSLLIPFLSLTHIPFSFSPYGVDKNRSSPLFFFFGYVFPRFCLVSRWLHRSISSHPSLWLVLDFHEMNNAGNRLVAALSVPRYRNVKRINLEFASDVEDKHLEIIKSKGRNSLGNLEVLNLNGCKKISDNGIEFITYACPKLKAFSIYWNVRVTDLGIKYLVKNCKHVIDLNLSGCKVDLDLGNYELFEKKRILLIS